MNAVSDISHPQRAGVAIQRHPKVRFPARPLVMRCGAFGDIVLLTVLLRQLHARFGQPADVIASGAWTRPLLEGQSALGELFIIRSRRTPYRLSTDQWRLVRWLCERGPRPTWFCDRDAGRQLSSRGGIPADHIHDLGPIDLPIPVLLRLLARADRMIAADTGPAHAAAALGCPTVALFGQADPCLYRPGGATSPAVALSGHVGAGQSILGIHPDTVIAAWTNLRVAHGRHRAAARHPVRGR